jgi:hypothetical protein
LFLGGVRVLGFQIQKFPAPRVPRFLIQKVLSEISYRQPIREEGLLPAFLSSRANAAELMKEGVSGNSSRLVNVITRVLVVGQILR